VAFIPSELVLESIILDGLTSIRNSIDTENDKIEEIFAELSAPHLNKYYGDNEINKIKDLVKNNIYVTQSFPIGDMKMPLICINANDESEDESNEHIEDFFFEEDTPITPTTIVGPFTIDNYNSVTGKVTLNIANPDLSNVRITHYLQDGNNNKFKILGGITNNPSDKHFMISPGQTINLANSSVISSVSIQRKTRRGIKTSVNLSIDIIAQIPLFVKYLFIMLKYIIASSKEEMIRRGFGLVKFNGSSFSMVEGKEPEFWYQRSLNLQIKLIEETWTVDDGVMADNFGLSAIKVQRNIYKREDEELMTIQTVEDD